jgi:hypothetical protein
VIIPTIPSRLELLTRAIKSVNNQTVQSEITFIVSHKRPDEISPVKHLCWELNSVLDAVNTPWVMRLADDDWLEPNHIQLLWEKIYLTKGKYTLYYSYDAQNHIPKINSTDLPQHLLKEKLTKENWIDGSGTIINYDMLRTVSGFGIGTKKYEDWDTWYAMSHYLNFSTFCLPIDTWHAGRGNYERIGGIK